MKFGSALLPLLFALMAAIGNAFYAFGQKKSSPTSGPFLFLIPTLSICIALLIVSVLFYRPEDLKRYLTENTNYFWISGVGLYFTFLGFYLLYSRYGASYYILYAVLSILTTSIFVGVFLFSEKVNLYHYLSIAAALVAILFFNLGQSSE
ncbi:transporter [Leptospira gomenensis]|uniref:Transporter n=1 Tax=Leptospira gomenensis TaxID=2484974 RepID=A0A5F1Z0N3_9LEPT|nr:EamA family transporter [Leptospira gomenensis]TGK27559.1 transporter [Leptospira gomenensis]TGK38229.1 transporter [Leptospira gomenensis]TGK42640.1 transporter [Leptospira gomenensis]TGK65803.1 transporter [Leptospira gomenensis]